MPSRTLKRLYFRGISKDITEDHLFKYLSRYGQISEVKMLSNYAFVQFESEKEALLVLETYKDQPLLGCRVIVEFAHPLRKDVASFSSNSSTQSRSAHRVVYARHPVVVLGLPKDIRWQELKDFGRSSGMLVAFCDLDKIQEGRGFIEFFSREDARLAVTTLNGKLLGGRKVRVIDHEDIHDSAQDSRRRDKCRSRSPRRHVDDRFIDILGARRVYSPVRRLTALNAAYDCPNNQYSEQPIRQYPSIICEEYTHWGYNYSEDSVGFERISSDYHGDQHNTRPFYDLGEGYDPRDGNHQYNRLVDPYQ